MADLPRPVRAGGQLGAQRHVLHPRHPGHLGPEAGGLFGLAASSVLNAMYYIPAILAIWGRKRAGEEQPLVWDWSDKPGKGTLVVLLAGNVFLGTAFGPVWELLQQGIALF